jgi:purine-binding chemotaxis protein CheW
MLTDTEDILTLPPDFLIHSGGTLPGTLLDLDMSMDDILSLSDDFPLDLPLQGPTPLTFLESPITHLMETNQTYAPGPEYIGEIVEDARPAAPSTGVALVARARAVDVEIQDVEIEDAEAAEAVPDTLEKHVIFSLAGAKYTVPMEQVLEVRELEHYTPVMNVPAWVLGITNLRGDIVSVVDLQKLVEPSAGDSGNSAARLSAHNLVVVQTLKGDLTTCLAVERVYGLAQAAPAEIQAVERIVGDGLTPHTRGLFAWGEELLSILNLESLLHSLEITH